MFYMTVDDIDHRHLFHIYSSIENATIVIGGDMNLPGWDWKENILKPNTVFTNLHNYFMDIINNNALS